MPRKIKPFEERLWAKIDKKLPHECWPWLGGTAVHGYGVLGRSIEGKWKQFYAHREVLSQVKGPPPSSNAHALHSCDNPSCCNPDHLSWGTNSMNRREARDRLHNQGNQKLLPHQVDAIRNDSRIYQEIADDFHVHRDTIARIKQKRSWQP